MNNNKSFVRKVIYIVIIGGLLIPLSLVSRPATRDASNGIKDPGGKLAQLRDVHDLSQAKMMEIDPASETMKLATLGLRGVAVNLLWMQAIEHKKKENWDQLASTLQALIKVQPNFVKVWEYQAHNLSYNISMEFDDYEYRYHWVKKGIGFLRDGVPYNRRDHRMTDNLGFFTGMKIGRSDEKNSFRRMFRQDEQFHNLMSDYIEPDTYDTREYGYDNWKMAYQWYDISRKMVDDQNAKQYSGDALFYMRRPAQLRNQAGSLKDEFRSDEIIQEIWRQAYEEWLKYGERQIVNTRGTMVTMEGMAEYGARIERLRAELDSYAPDGTREELTKDLIKELNLTPEYERILDLPPEQRTDEEARIAAYLTASIFEQDKAIDMKIMMKANEKDQLPAKRLVEEILVLVTQMFSIRQQDGVTNYKYWRERTRAEASEIVLQARRNMYDANEVRKQSIFDDEYQFDYKTKEKKIIQKGAISLYLEAFETWARAFEEFPDVRFGELGDRTVERLREYQNMLQVSGMEWPDDHPLQEFIDVRSERDDLDRLPTSQDLADRRADREEAAELERENQAIEDEIEAEANKQEGNGDDDASSEEGDEGSKEDGSPEDDN